MSEYWLYTRVKSVKKPRQDWVQRWYAAAHSVDFKGVVTELDAQGRPTGRMIARKDSPIWFALAKGTGGFRDAIGKGEPPFAYNSGMGWIEHRLSKAPGDSIWRRHRLAQLSVSAEGRNAQNHLGSRSERAR